MKKPYPIYPKSIIIKQRNSIYYTSHYYIENWLRYNYHNESGPALITKKSSSWWLFGYKYHTTSNLLKLLSLTSVMAKVLAPNWCGISLQANLLMDEIIKNNNFSKLNKRQKEKIYKLGDNYLTRKLYSENEEWKEYMIIRDIIK